MTESMDYSEDEHFIKRIRTNMKFYLNGPPNLQINETKKMAKCIYWRQKKKKKVHSLPNKNQDRSELILIEIQSFQIERAPNGGPYQDT